MIFQATILAIAAALPTAVPDTASMDADPYFILTEEADSAIAHQDWAAAAARLADALAVRPDTPTNLLLRSNLAAVYSCLGHDSLALDTYDAVLDEAPSMFTPRLSRGKLLLKMGRDIEAYHDFSAALDADSLSTEARYYHGMMALYAGSREIAEADFSTLARIAPKAYDTAVALASLYSLTGRDREAIPYLERLIEADPSAEYFASLAGCHLALGQLSEAGAVISRGLKSFPRDPELYYYRAWLNRDRYRLDEAEADGRTAVQLGASPVRVADLLGHREPHRQRITEKNP